MIAALGGRRAPRNAPDDYVRRQFDSYAEDFDKSLVGDLEYQAPELIEKALKAVRAPDAPPADIADLGCGTGLVGPRVRPWARSLVGIDLSPKMIREARKRRVYDKLVMDEITKLPECTQGRLRHHHLRRRDHLRGRRDQDVPRRRPGAATGRPVRLHRRSAARPRGEADR